MTTITKLKAALEALEANHQWHIDHDHYSGCLGYEPETRIDQSITDLRSVIAEMEAGEPVNESLAQDIECIDLRYRGDPSYEHDGFYIRKRAAEKVRNGYKIYTHSQPKADEWNARGSLARLKCWHRLTREESDELVSMQMQWILKTQITQPKAEQCQHSIADARNPVVKNGYICVKCGALFSAADHAQPKAEPAPLEEYDAGLLNDFGGGKVEWWQDYIRAELGRAFDHYQSQVAQPKAEP